MTQQPSPITASPAALVAKRRGQYRKAKRRRPPQKRLKRNHFRWFQSCVGSVASPRRARETVVADARHPGGILVCNSANAL